MEIELYSKLNDPIDAIDKLGVWFAKSGFFGVDSVEAGKTLAFICVTERMTPTQLLSKYDIVRGKMRPKALALLAEFRKGGGKHQWVETGHDGKKATIRLDYDGQSIISTYTIEQAQKAGLVKADSGWDKNVSNMLRARAITDGVNMIRPELTYGLGEESEEQPVPVKALLAPAKAIAIGPEAIPVGPMATSAYDDSHPDLQPEKSKVVTLPAPARAEQNAKNDTFKAAEKDGKLTVETLARLQEIIGDKEAEASTWLLSKKWIKSEMAFETMRAARAQQIIDKPEGFMKMIGGEK